LDEDAIFKALVHLGLKDKEFARKVAKVYREEGAGRAKAMMYAGGWEAYLSWSSGEERVTIRRQLGMKNKEEPDA
jgi:hypothetical protein